MKEKLHKKAAAKCLAYAGISKAVLGFDRFLPKLLVHISLFTTPKSITNLAAFSPPPFLLATPAHRKRVHLGRGSEPRNCLLREVLSILKITLLTGAGTSIINCLAQVATRTPELSIHPAHCTQNNSPYGNRV